MKLPTAAARLRLDRDLMRAPYPPLGFVPFAEHAFGNGDAYGLYWPVGRELQEPIVVEMVHDEGRLEPVFSSVEAFLAAAESVDVDDPVEAPTLDADPHSPLACLRAAKAMSHDETRVDEVIALLERAVSVLPEYGQAQAALCMQYLRRHRARDAAHAGLAALIAPPSFGGGSQAVLYRLRGQGDTGEAVIDDDPIWRARHTLSLAFGGVKDNPDYAVLRDAIEHYVGRADTQRAYVLMQSYAETMSAETTSFRERQGYDQPAFLARLFAMSGLLPGGPRLLPTR